MKRFLALMMAAIMVLGLTACGGKEEAASGIWNTSQLLPTPVIAERLIPSFCVVSRYERKYNDVRKMGVLIYVKRNSDFKRYSDR